MDGRNLVKGTDEKKEKNKTNNHKIMKYIL